ncbi:MAG: CoA transferase [Halieaceae bacterium]|jgi:crotonobetainyl-CoA:carnitine CoA-transferase CaiB-like acyl-CoA transferase|nr:CoA transferase [Halieaceae bacterium]
MTGPLAGVRVLDLGTMIAGPVASTVLADQGADVIKIEPPGMGDLMRYLGATRNGVSSLFHNCNRGKRSVALNLKAEEGLALLKELVAGADVVAENFRHGVTRKLGIDYESLSAVNPELIYLSICGFGDRGPLAERPAYDNVIQTFAGVATSQANFETGEPQLYQQLFCDKITALNGAQSVCAALLARERGAGGQHIRLSMADAAVSFLWCDVAGTRSFLEEGAHEGIKVGRGLRLLKFSDGYGTASPVTDKQFHGFCRALGVDSSDPRLATVADRNANTDLLMEIIKDTTMRALSLTTAEAIGAMEAEGVPCAPANELVDMPEHPQMQANESFVEFEHPQAGNMVEPANPPNFSSSGAPPLRAAAGLGENTDSILGELGKTPEQLKNWRDAGVIG